MNDFTVLSFIKKINRYKKKKKNIYIYIYILKKKKEEKNSVYLIFRGTQEQVSWRRIQWSDKTLQKIRKHKGRKW